MSDKVFSYSDTKIPGIYNAVVDYEGDLEVSGPPGESYYFDVDELESILEIAKAQKAKYQEFLEARTRSEIAASKS